MMQAIRSLSRRLRANVARMFGRALTIIRRLRQPQPKPVILMYHRIADEPVDPWGLSVPPSLFEEQLVVLCRTRMPMGLEDFTRQLKAGTLPANAVSLTFD